MKKHSLYFILLFFFSVGSIQGQIKNKNKVRNIIQKSEKKNEGDYSIAIQNLNNPNDSFFYHASEKKTPASIVKLFTTASSLAIHGKSFRFTTDIFITPYQNNENLQGDLIIKTSGDPSIASKFYPLDSTRFLSMITRVLIKKGIWIINGDLIIDTSCFEKKGQNPLWDKEDYGEAYGTGIYGANFSDNQAKITYQTFRNNTPAQRTSISPLYSGLYLTENIKVKRKGYFWIAKGKELKNQRYIQAVFPPYRKNITICTSLPNPPQTMGYNILRWLKIAGIKVKGNLKILYKNQIHYNKLKLIAQYQSPYLYELIKATNYHSINHYAEAILKSLALDSLDKPIQTSKALSIEKKYWKDRGIRFSPSFKLIDGSGLSRKNQLTAIDIQKLLQFLYQKLPDIYTPFFNSLPLCGKDGSVKHFLKKSPLNFYAKSGSMRGVQNYAGFLLKNGEIYSVVLLSNKVKKRREVIKKMQLCLENLFL